MFHSFKVKDDGFSKQGLEMSKIDKDLLAVLSLRCLKNFSNNSINKKPDKNLSGFKSVLINEIIL